MNGLGPENRNTAPEPVDFLLATENILLSIGNLPALGLEKSVDDTEGLISLYLRKEQVRVLLAEYNFKAYAMDQDELSDLNSDAGGRRLLTSLADLYAKNTGILVSDLRTLIIDKKIVTSPEFAYGLTISVLNRLLLNDQERIEMGDLTVNRDDHIRNQRVFDVMMDFDYASLQDWYYNLIGGRIVDIFYLP